jgi:hypothetical protein
MVIGSDAVSLFPSLTKQESADEVAEAVLESDLKWEGINWKEAVRYLALGRDEVWCRSSKLRRVLPWRKSNKGSRPGLRGVGPLGAEVNDEKQWNFPDVELTKLEKKMIMSEVLRLSIELMFTTHIYSFGGRSYKQRDGGPIGLRSMCALARVVMARWDCKWKARMTENNIVVEDDGRFVDDARVFLYAVRPGWRWERSGLWYKKEWEEEDTLLSPTERTKRMIQASMQGLTKCLSFTVETCEDFSNGWLPTLDFQIRVTESNIIEYSFYEKPTAPNRCLQADTALNQNSLMRCLSNEVGMRLDSFSETVALRERVAALDRFSQKLLNSGHSLATVRKILVGGIKGYQRKVARCAAARTPIHRSSSMSAASRRTKKLLAKSNWFRSNKEVAETGGEESSHPWEEQPGVTGIVRQPARRQARVAQQKENSSIARPSPSTSQELRTSTVLFIEFSKGGSLQKCMRGVLDKLTPMLGFRVRVTERGGTTLGSLLSNKNLWSGEACGREDCRPCKQEGDKKEPCTTRNIVYESECGTCNPEGSRKVADRKSLAESRDVPSLYVGETARSLKERSGEHWADAEGGKEESHMVEHQVLAHGGGVHPSFNFKVVKHCGSSLERQVREAVRIQMRGLVLNKKGTYNRCKLTRLVVDTEWEDKVWRESWAPREEQVADGKEYVEWEGEECLAVTSKVKRGRDEPKAAKRIRVENEDGQAWGETVPDRVAARSTFLYSSSQRVTEGRNNTQTKIKPISGVEWMCREILKELANSAVSLADMSVGVAEWEEWQGEEVHHFPKRTEREEKYLWAMLRITDKDLAREEKKIQAKKDRVVANARKKDGSRQKAAKHP